MMLCIGERNLFDCICDGLEVYGLFTSNEGFPQLFEQHSSIVICRVMTLLALLIFPHNLLAIYLMMSVLFFLNSMTT